MSDGSMKAVVTAIIANGSITIAKFSGYAFSGSSAMLAEAVHSLADTANQALLLVGLRRSARKADQHHHFGYGQERYFWNLVSAVTIFFLGCVYTIMHAIEQLRHGAEPMLSLLSFAIIGFAFLAEGYSFLVAMGEFRKQAKEEGMGPLQYFRETRDPTTLAVLIEDSVALFGLTFALVGMALSALTGSAIFDAIAAILIGLLMGSLAFYLARVNRKYLLNTADSYLNAAAQKAWDNHPQVQQVHRLSSIVLSPEESVLMAEVELREEALFADMSEVEVQQAIRFMQRLLEIRRSLEAAVQEHAPDAGNVYIEFSNVHDGTAAQKP